MEKNINTSVHIRIPRSLCCTIETTQPCKSTILQFFKSVVILWGHFHIPCDDLLEARHLLPPLPNPLWDLMSPPTRHLAPTSTHPTRRRAGTPFCSCSVWLQLYPQIPAWQPPPPLSLATNPPFLCGPSLVILLTLKEGPNHSPTHPQLNSARSCHLPAPTECRWLPPARSSSAPQASTRMGFILLMTNISAGTQGLAPTRAFK